MIDVTISRVVDTFVFEVKGHAVAQNSDEGVKVCAGVSSLMLTLYALCDRDGAWAGDRNGSMRVHVPVTRRPWADFALTGMLLIDRNYPGHMHVAVEPGLTSQTEGAGPWVQANFL